MEANQFVDRFTVRDMIEELSRQDPNKIIVVERADGDDAVGGVQSINGSNRIKIIVHEGNYQIR